jgi:hypothetical protein
MVLSVNIELPKKTTVRHTRKKEKTSSVFTENSPESIKPFSKEDN